MFYVCVESFMRTRVLYTYMTSNLVFSICFITRRNMPAFRWPYIAQDIALATEVSTVRPSRATDWEEIATTLTTLFSTPEKQISLKGRGCKEQMDLLLRKYREEDSKALKR